MRLHATRRAAIAQGRGLGNPLWDLAGVPASLDHRFAESKSLVDAVSGQNLITFTRQSDRSIITSTGGMDIIGTATAGFTHDPFTLESLGLFLEELRPNLLLNSAAPASQNITVAATAYTLSFYGSGDIVLTGAHSATVIGTGVFPNRRVLTFTPTAGTLGVTVSGTVEFANLEPGSFATSWIPTGASQATRSADVASITGANFSSWFNASEFTIYTQGASGATTNFPTFAEFSDGTANNRIQLGYITPLVGGLIVRSASATVAELYPSVTTLQRRAAFGVAANDFGVSYNGAAVTSDASGATPTGINRLEIGNLLNGGAINNLNGTIRRLCFFPQRLPNSTLQNITL
jgi:hypothetical protein